MRFVSRGHADILLVDGGWTRKRRKRRRREKKMVPFRVLGLDVRVDGGYWRRVSLFSVGCFTLGVRDRMRGWRGVISTEEEDEFGRGGERGCTICVDPASDSVQIDADERLRKNSIEVQNMVKINRVGVSLCDAAVADWVVSTDCQRGGVSPRYKKIGVALTYVAEGPMAFLIIAPTKVARRAACLGQILFQVGIILSGNYAYFNLLTIVLSMASFAGGERKVVKTVDEKEEDWRGVDVRRGRTDGVSDHRADKSGEKSSVFRADFVSGWHYIEWELRVFQSFDDRVIDGELRRRREEGGEDGRRERRR